ncbi:MAG: papain fold toxin domain-containing protein [Nostocaceae cyanobacterium]|nr:papain fold toxin domain-containing protein [Nostocaceae cyanobacterium]
MNNLSDEEIYREVGNITARYQLKLYQCYECVKAVMQWLQEKNIKGRIIKIQTSDGEDYIISKRLENQGINESITRNGIHYGVEVQGKVFDNLSAKGLTREDWLNDFICPSGEFLVNYLDKI